MRNYFPEKMKRDPEKEGVFLFTAMIMPGDLEYFFSFGHHFGVDN
jgi:hypothetical protein